jgi:hypothetical protein
MGANVRQGRAAGMVSADAGVTSLANTGLRSGGLWLQSRPPTHPFLVRVRGRWAILFVRCDLVP